ncbi:X-ray repair cross-complementing protein 5 [Osmerus mordax]|uniref:X-ray repair cross-complementing protein 5 n=1 Tax=Osmerus mordax TaxID=8014 RepID=UPI00350EF92B
MARSSKSALVLCMDVGFSMSNSAPGQESPFEQAKKVIQKFIQRQVFAENKDELGLVLFGTDTTKNLLADDSQYQNITVHRHMMLPDFDLLEEVHSQIQPGSQQADWLDALVVCMDLLQKESLGKKFERLNIAILTDLHTKVNTDQLDVIIENLKKASITLQFFLPFPLDDDEDEEDGDGAGGSSGRPAHRGKGLSREQKQGMETVRQIMLALDEEDGLEEVYPFSEAIEKLSIFKSIERRPTAWPCQLTIGSSLSIKILGYKAVAKESLKKSWMTVDAQTNRKEDVKRDVVFCLEDDNETEVERDDTIQGFRYGSDIVPFSKVDQDQMKYKAEGKCFAVLGFAKQNMIHRHHFMGDKILKVFSPKDDEHAAVALSALIRALDELNMVAIVRYVYDRRCNPQVGAAFPCIKDKYECLMYVQLPFMEDLRQFTFPSLENNKKFTPSEAQLAAMDSVIDSMMLVEEGESGKQEDLFKVHHIQNPTFQRLFQCLHHRGLNPDTHLPSIEPWLLAALERPPVVSARCHAPLEELKKKFPLKEAVKKKELKTSIQIFGSSSEEPEAKKVKLDEDEDFNLADITAGSVSSVGSVDPARDFCSLVRQKSLPFGEVCQQLIGRIEQLVSQKSTHYYMKAISCIQVFREQSVKAGNAELFNSYLQSLKRSIPDRGLHDFWGLLAQDVLTLINKDEVEGSSASKQEANEFLLMGEKEEVTAASAEGGADDVDDLLDMM